MIKKIIAVFIAIVIVFGTIPIDVFANNSQEPAKFEDMPENWSRAALENAVENGLLSGVDGKIMPNEKLTRAQMATVITRAFGAKDKGNISKFSDVKASDWFYDSMSKAYKMGVIKGSNNKLNPKEPITRQEAFVMIARAFKLEPADVLNKSFEDTDQISDWAKEEVYSLINNEYIQGSNGKINPKGNITRAEFAQVFYNIVKEYIQTEGTYKNLAKGNIMVSVPNVILKDLTIEGDLIIGDGVGEGDVILDSVKVRGRIVVRGGGENSIIIKGNSDISNIIVAKVDGVVSIKVQGDANVEIIYIDDESDDVNIEGQIGNLQLMASGIIVGAIDSQIKTIDIIGKNSKVIIDKDSKVENININKEAVGIKLEVVGIADKVTTQAPNTQITGKGKVSKVEVKEGGNNAKIETTNTKIQVDKGVTGVTLPPTPPSPSSSGGSSSGGSSSGGSSSGGSSSGGTTVVSVGSININKSKTTLVEGTTETLTVTFTPSNASNKTITWTTSDASKATIDSTGKVRAVSAGTATITAKSNNGKTATCVVTVTTTVVPVSAINVNKETTTLVVGATETITATVEPGDASNKNVTWTSSKDAIATVDANGKITAVAVGEAVITVTSVADSSKKATVGVTVKAETLVSDFVFDASTKTITDYTGTEKSVAIPAKIGGVDVEVIGNKAFSNKGLTSVVIPNSVTSIGKHAFIANKLTSVVIPDSVTSIKQGAFSKNELTSINIPNSITTIEKEVFEYNKLTSIVIPDSVTSIGEFAFLANELTSIEIPNSVASIGASAFLKNELTSILIPNSVTSIGVVAFNDNQLPDDQAFIYARKSDGAEDKSKIVSYGGAKRENVIIPDSVKTIGEAAFMDNELLSITIPNSVTTIEEYAFGDNKLTEVTIPISVTTLGDGAFEDNGPSSTSGNIPTSDFVGTWEIKDSSEVWTKKGVVSVSAITVNKIATTLTVGATETITATVEPSNASNKKVTWTSSKDAIATVVNGKITAVAVGEAVITVTTEDGGHEATCIVTVTETTPETVTVTFDSDGGSAVASSTINKGDKVTKPVDPTKTGYIFNEWQLSGVTYDFNAEVNADMTLKATWTETTPETVTVTFDSDGGSAVASSTINKGDKVTKPVDPTKTGYIFNEWQLSGVAYDFNAEVNADMTLKATWTETTPETVTVTFDSDGGSAVASSTINKGDKVTKPVDPTKTGYIFNEWQLSGVTYDFNAEVNADMTLKATWTETTPETVTVTFDSDGGSAVASSTINKGDKVTKPVDPTKTGYIFNEWQLSGVAYDFNAEVNADMILKATWTETTPETVTVTFDSDGGSAVASSTINKGDKVTKPVDPTKTGYIFNEWQLSGVAYDFNAEVNADMTLKATWTETTPETVTVTFDSDGGSAVASSTINKGDKVTKPVDPTKTGYIFNEWQLSGVAYDFNAEVNADMTLKATWTETTPETVTVTFDSDGGSAVASSTINKGDKVTKPVDPTKTGYIFNEWQLSGVAYDFNAEVNADMTLKATWTETTPETVTVTIAGDAVVTTDYTIAGATDLEAVAKDAKLTITAVTNITVNGDEVAASGTKVITITEATTIIINKQAPADTTPPVITLLGNATVNIANGASYTDAGATALDDVDGDITSEIVVVGDTFDTSTAGTYVITYNVSDAASNPAEEVTRTVIVAAESDTTINIKAIPGVTAPVTGAIPDITAIDADQYTGTIVWTLGDETFDTPFAAGKKYTATITLEAKPSYTLAGVGADFFTVDGATTTNAENDGVVTAVFSTTGTVANNIKILGTDNTEYTLNNLPKGLSWDGSILTMNNFKGKYIHQGSYSENGLDKITINLVGNENKLIAGSNRALWFSEGITIQGTEKGKLTLESNNRPHAVDGGMTIQGKAEVIINVEKSLKRVVIGDEVIVKNNGKLEVKTVGEDISGSSVRVANRIYLEDQGNIKVNLTNEISTQSDARIANDIPYIQGKAVFKDSKILYYEKAAYKVVGEWTALHGEYASETNAIKLTYTVPNSVDKLYTGDGNINYAHMKMGLGSVTSSVKMYNDTGFTNEVTSIDLYDEDHITNIIYVKAEIEEGGSKEEKYYIITIKRDKAGVAEISEDKEALTADSIKGENTDLDNIIGALENPLPSTGAKGSTITWQSNKPEVVSNDGQTIKRPNIGEGNDIVTLTATLKKDLLTETKDFVLTVLELEPSTIEFANAGPITKIFGDPAFTNGVTGDGAGVITYSSENTGVATVDSSSGKVTIVGIGTTVITASKAATTSHATVTNSYTLTVNAKALEGIDSISGIAKVGEKLTAGSVTPLEATFNYQWLICDTADGEYSNIDGATNSTYTILAENAGKYIKVVATGTGNYSGTVTSDATVKIENAEQAAPASLAGVTPTSVANSDGKITGTTTEMEYKLSSATEWIKVTATEITGLAAGTYNVRYAAKTGFNAGATADVIVAAYDSTAQDNADIATAKSNIEAASYTATQVEITDAAKALTKAQALVEALELKGTTATVVAGTFTEATAGTEGSINGTDGSYTFTVTIAKGSGTQKTTTVQKMTITATPYDSTAQDNADIESAKTNIESAAYTATQAEASDSAKALTKAQALVNALGTELKGTTANVLAGTFTGAITGTEDSVNGTDGSFSFTVKIGKGLGTEVTTVEKTMTITATKYDPTQNNADIAAAKAKIESAAYTATQAEVSDASAAKTKVEEIVNVLDTAGTIVEVVPGSFSGAIAGVAGVFDPTDGSYTFTVKINKGGGTEAITKELSLTITAETTTVSKASKVTVNKDKTLDSSKPYLVNGEPAASGTLGSADCTAHFDSSTGVLTLQGYNGAGIRTLFESNQDLIIKLIGDNNVTTTSSQNGIYNGHYGNIYITSDSDATLNVNSTSDNNYVYAIATHDISGKSIMIGGKAKVTVTAKTTAASKKTSVAHAGKDFIIQDNASFTGTSTATAIDSYGVFAKGKIIINTTGNIDIDCSASIGSYAFNGMSGVDIKNVTLMTLKIPADGYYGTNTADLSRVAVHINKTNNIATYRGGVPYNLTLSNGQITAVKDLVIGTEIQYEYQGLENDEITIKAKEISNFAFVKWMDAEGNDLDASLFTVGSASSPEATIKMPAKDMNIKAEYKSTLFTVQPSFHRSEKKIKWNVGEATFSASGDSFKLQKKTAGEWEVKTHPIITSTAAKNGYIEVNNNISNHTLYTPDGNYRLYFKVDGKDHYSEEFVVEWEDTINIAAIPGVTPPVTGATPVTTIAETTEYTATITWSPADATFGASTVYTATITLTPKAGYTLTGVAENFFTVEGAAATNAADTGVVTAVFPKTASNPLGGTVSITGTLKFGETLTADTSALTGNSGTLSYQWKSDGTNVGANQDTYTTVESDIGKTITVDVTSSVETGTITGTAGGIISKADGPSAPAVVGSASTPADEILVVGGEEKITVTVGTNMSAAYEYSVDGGSTWTDLGVAAGVSGDITGLTSAVTEIQIRVKTTTTHEAGAAATQAVTVTDAVGELGGTVSITGTLKFGETLTADTSALTGNSGTLSYQWKSDGTNVGANQDTYTTVESDIGKTITVDVTSSVETGTITGTAGGIISKADGPSAPAVVGSASTPADEILVVGGEEKITVTVGTNMSAAYEYSVNSGTDWTDLGVAAGVSGDITGLTSAVTEIQIRVKTTPTHEAGAAATQAVTVTDAVGELGGTVSITGTLKFGETLTADTSALTGNSGTLSYQWKSDGTNVGTNQDTYTTVESDIGNTITVDVTSSVETGTITGTAGSAIAKAEGPAAISENYAGTFPVAATSINLTGLGASATGLEAAVAIDGTNYDAYVALTVDGDGNATITGLTTDVTISTKVKVRVAETGTHLAGADKEITVTAE